MQNMFVYLAAAAADLEECRLVYDALLPFTATFGGLDAGSFSVGTVYAALGAAIVAIGWISVGMLGKDTPKDS